ncbi:MAG: DUF4835 domain-containing protein [Crocinitomicaceae bacterium]|nr:DUF4835 domain-containing protein [Crocinitomicaceae bacterium]
MLNKLLFTLSFFLVLVAAQAQDVLCDVQVSSSQVEGSEKTMFDALQTKLYEFVNNRKWTNDVFKQEERIEFSILINITDRVSTNRYNATIQVQSRRPVYGSAYNSTLFNHQDEDFTFEFNQFDVFNYSDQAATNQLTAVIAFYTYYVIALDYESFSPLGGTPYFERALNIVNQNQAASESGWKAFEGQSNRYWLVTNMLDTRFNGLRQCFYEYHRLGLDQMHDDVEDGRAAVLTALKKLEGVHTRVPNSFTMRVFFNAKADEIVKMMKNVDPSQKTQLIQLLDKISPANTNKWSKINSD